MRVEILGDDRAHAAGLDAARPDGSARPSERGLIRGHELGRTRQSLQGHTRIAPPPEIAMHAATHCLVTLWRSASHGLLASVGCGSPKCSTVPSGMVMLVTLLPSFSARLTSVPTLGLR